MSTPSLIEACRARQTRCVEWLRANDADALVVTQNAHVYYLSGAYYSSLFQPTFLLEADGQGTLIAPQKAPDMSATDEVLTYEAKRHSTMRNDQRQAAAEVLLNHCRGRSPFRKLAVEYSTWGQHYAELATSTVDVEPELYRQRRTKDAVELELLRKAINATGEMYKTARSILRPGLNELDMFNALQATAVNSLGEMLTGTGNDYQANSRGGAPRNRTIAAGELYILDLGPAYRGYYGDTARTLAVSEPTPEQSEAWRRITEVFSLVEAEVKPGKSCQALFHQVQALLDQAPHGKFNHHLGHGIGLFPHEGPHLNPFWDDTFQIGDVFTAEPGLYAPELRAGLRVENDYLVTETGVELLSPFGLEM